MVSGSLSAQKDYNTTKLQFLKSYQNAQWEKKSWVMGGKAYNHFNDNRKKGEKEMSGICKRPEPKKSNPFKFLERLEVKLLTGETIRLDPILPTCQRSNSFTHRKRRTRRTVLTMGTVTVVSWFNFRSLTHRHTEFNYLQRVSNPLITNPIKSHFYAFLEKWKSEGASDLTCREDPSIIYIYIYLHLYHGHLVCSIYFYPHVCFEGVYCVFWLCSCSAACFLDA